MDSYSEENLNDIETESTGAAQPAGETAGSFLKSLLIDVIIAIILAAIVLFFIRPTIVKQSSMEDTLHENDYMIMYKQAYRSHTPERGDIIIFQSTMPDENTGRDKLLIKRVIGLPGDDISIINDQLYINGEEYQLASDTYTSSDDGVCTRVNLYNAWVNELPEDARGATDKSTPTPMPLKKTDKVETLEIQFTFTEGAAAKAA